MSYFRQFDLLPPPYLTHAQSPIARGHYYNLQRERDLTARQVDLHTTKVRSVRVCSCGPLDVCLCHLK